MSFGVVSGVGRGMGVLEGSPHVLRGRGFPGFCFRHCIGVVNKHIQAKRAKYSDVHIMETTAWIPSKFCIPVKTSKYASWVVQKHGTQIYGSGRPNI